MFYEGVSELMECVIDSVKQVVPLQVYVETPYLHDATELKTAMCTLVGFTGEITGRMLIDGEIESFGKLGETMFGMALEGEMLHSFVGEVANMVAGNMCTSVSRKGRKIDITPPTIIEGEMKLYGFERANYIPFAIEHVGKLNIILLLKEEKEI